MDKKIYVQVEEHSNQHYQIYVGELLLATNGVERYADKYMQVPALLIKTKTGIEFVKLERQCYRTEVKLITEEQCACLDNIKKKGGGRE